MSTNEAKTLQMLPKIDELLLKLAEDEICASFAKALLKRLCQDVVAAKRQELLAFPEVSVSREGLVTEAAAAVLAQVERLKKPRLQRVINATGVILHTNLGRSPLSSGALAAIQMSGFGYANVELALSDGKRGLRYDNLHELIYLLTGTEDVVVVNNNAAAVLLILDTLADGKEVIVSRGELVEIGGGFRVPEVMRKSGALLKEVGTTNRTRLDDYADAITANTALLMKVHTSNFKMVGFCEDTPLTELVALGRERGIPVCYDLGSGSLVELRRYGIEGEPMLSEVLASGVDIVSVSGDKLIGGPQAGIILGKKALLAAIAKNPLNRALRVDKLTLAALEGTLRDYLLDEEGIRAAICPVRYLSRDLGFLKRGARRLIKMIKSECGEAFTLSLTAGKSFAGGGALPGYELDSILITLRHARLTAETLALRLRSNIVPVIVRVANDLVLFDMRTLEEAEYPPIAAALKNALDNGHLPNG